LFDCPLNIFQGATLHPSQKEEIDMDPKRLENLGRKLYKMRCSLEKYRLQHLAEKNKISQVTTPTLTTKHTNILKQRYRSR
jgi:hypothetical protein